MLTILIDKLAASIEHISLMQIVERETSSGGCVLVTRIVILQRREFIFTQNFKNGKVSWREKKALEPQKFQKMKQNLLGKFENIKNKLFQLDAVRLVRLNSLSALIDERNLLLGNMILELILSGSIEKSS